MIRKLLAATLLLSSAAMTHAAPTDVVFKGGMTVPSTSGCTNWNPDKQFFVGTYWVPVAGSTNGPDSVINMHSGNSSEGFQLDNGVFTSAFKAVHAVHSYTRIGTYNAFIKVTNQLPTTILTTTQKVTVDGSIKGFDGTPTCIVKFTMSLVRDLQP
jgi:hypothetical protein